MRTIRIADYFISKPMHHAITRHALSRDVEVLALSLDNRITRRFAGFVVVLAFYGLLCGNTYGQLGAKESELVARWGEPDSKNSLTDYVELKFRTNEWRITATIYKERAAEIFYDKYYSSISPEECTALLNRNSANGKWGKVSTYKDFLGREGDLYARSDGEASAKHCVELLWVTSKQFSDYKRAQREKEKEERLKQLP